MRMEEIEKLSHAVDRSLAKQQINAKCIRDKTGGVPAA